jgi:hypothetical protein
MQTETVRCCSLATQTDVEEVKQEVAQDTVQDKKPETETDSSKEEQTTLTQASQDSMADAEEFLYEEIKKRAAILQATLAEATAEADEPTQIRDGFFGSCIPEPQSPVLAPDDEITIYEVVLLLLAQVEAKTNAGRVSPPFSQSPQSSATALAQVREYR